MNGDSMDTPRPRPEVRVGDLFHLFLWSAPETQVLSEVTRVLPSRVECGPHTALRWTGHQWVEIPRVRNGGRWPTVTPADIEAVSAAQLRTDLHVRIDPFCRSQRLTLDQLRRIAAIMDEKP